MKSPAFGCVQPKTINDALESLQRHRPDTAVLAGGQSLMASLNMRLSNPAVLIDINGIDDLNGISVVEDQLRIGAMTRQVELEHSPLVAQHAPLVSRVIPACMVALQGQIVLQGPDGERRIAAEEFFQGLFETALSDNELLTAIEIPIAKHTQRFGFRELARRHGDYAMAGVCAASDWSSNNLIDLRLAYLNVGPGPVLAEQTASGICRNWGQNYDEVLEGLGSELDPTDDLNATSDMRIHLAKVLTRRLLEEWR